MIILPFMNVLSRFLRVVSLSVLTVVPFLTVAAAQGTVSGKEIPDPLKAWESWATWDDEAHNCPTPYSTPEKHLCFWPSRLGLQVDNTTGHFDLTVAAFSRTWIPLPGGREVWPLNVKANGAPVPVVEHNGNPSIHVVASGTYQIEGNYRWDAAPQRIPLPREIGILALTLDGKPVDTPAWDAQGFLWLKREGSSEEATKDFMSVKVYAVMEDGIPFLLDTQAELIVSGKSREEEIGGILPKGWKLSAVDSPIPVLIDDAGRMKAQVRAGKWTVRAEGFRLDNFTEVSYAPSIKPAVKDELIAFRSKPDFRMIEIVGAPGVDVSQTTFPNAWRNLPVYRWNTASPFRVEERMRGMGAQKQEGLHIDRELWLDENGRALTFRDRITGKMQQIWRLDAAPGQDLGSVRSDGQGQLITRNPQTGAPGIELRSRNVNLETIGRMERAKALSATGWSSDADDLKVTLNISPGWRLFALFGADWVRGDWLTAWTLLDLFLVLIFSLAVSRLWGLGAGLLAFLAFGLSYHEAGAPRYTWLLLLIPLALLRVVPDGWSRRVLFVWKWISVATLILVLAPFIAQQIRQTIYPQLEDFGSSHNFWGATIREEADFCSVSAAAPFQKAAASKSNLLYDTGARIQTGPGVPTWSWNTASFGWNGPVSASQQIHPVLIPLRLQRLLTILRVALLLALAAILLNARQLRGTIFGATGKSTAVLLLIFWATAASSATAQMPDQTMLKTLRDRLLEPSDAYPNAADIPFVSLALNERHITIDAEIHAAIRTAVPLPGRLPAWSPLTVIIDGKPDAALRRDDGYLWVVVPEGVHHVHLEGQLAEVTEWEWTFQLKPHKVSIEAPGWTFSGVRPDGIPEQQVFFALKQKSTAGQSSYERQDLQTVTAIDRNLELGLVWQVRTAVTRLSPEGKAVDLRIPLLPGENVLSSNAVVKDGVVEVRLGAHENAFTWESELSVADRVKLTTSPSDSWAERWHLVVSPVWNVAISGLAPTFEPGNPELVPVWHPWPGESVELSVTRPASIPGATVTVSKGTHQVTLGNRQRVSKLDLSLRCSLGEDFLVGLPADAEITTLTHDEKAIPVRKDGAKLIIPLHPGEQAVSIGWKTNTPLGVRATAGEVQLPVESANIDTVISMPENRWVLWTAGPLRGPAVEFWGILACSLFAAGVLGLVTHSPLRPIEWMLLVIGLTQVPLPAALAIIGWLFLLAWRGSDEFQKLPSLRYNLLQLFIIALTAAALGIFIEIVSEGLLGRPEMFITGNASTWNFLNWYQARCEVLLPRPSCISISIWWYRFLMLLWALWLASSLIRWLGWGWRQFSKGGIFRRAVKKTSTPSPLGRTNS